MLKRVKSFEHNQGVLYLVATPIGNLDDISQRALDVLTKVDVIACEDTRNTKKLLMHFNIQTHLIAHHQYNEKPSSNGIIELLAQGKKVAMVSDAGYPCISDPGNYLVQAVIEANYPVITIPGANAMLQALVNSGLSTKHFFFYGFLDAKENKRCQELQELVNFPYTMVFYEAPHRIKQMLKSILEILGNRKMVLARELTKIHEEYIYGQVDEVMEIVDDLKGEMVVVVEGCKQQESSYSNEDYLKMIDEEVAQGHHIKEAIKIIAKKYHLSKNELYQLYHKNS